MITKQDIGEIVRYWDAQKRLKYGVLEDVEFQPRQVAIIKHPTKVKREKIALENVELAK